MELCSIQPSQLYISELKLVEVRRRFAPISVSTLDPIPVKRLDEEVIFTDGHTRAFAAFLAGLREVRVFWDEDDLDWEAYRICVQWCKDEGIYTVGDLEGRVIPHSDYEVLWYERCAKMQRALKEKRSSS